jgi:hypothetical protein
MENHHLVLGETIDCVSGETIVDTHDERYRQKLAQFLLRDRGYTRDDIEPRSQLSIRVDSRQAEVAVDYKISLGRTVAMIVKYAPGSIVTRQRSALAISRLVAPYQVPWVVVSNGIDADILDGASGRLIGRGLDAVPPRAQLVESIAGADFSPVSNRRRDMEARIVMACEVHGACNCTPDGACEPLMEENP